MSKGLVTFKGKKVKIIITFSILFGLISCSQIPNQSSIERLPSSKHEKCAEMLGDFYKDQDKDRMISRVKATKKDPHKFYRSFPPLYYKLVKDLNFEKELGPIFKEETFIGGDVHIENFGVRPFKKEWRLLINDFDDFAYGPTILDPIRLLTSIKLSGFKVNKEFIQEFLRVYKLGLKGESFEFSKNTRKIFKNALKESRLSPKKFDPISKKFLKKREPNFEMTDLEMKFFIDEFSKFGKVVDGYKYVKESGGSGGLDRYELLIERNNEFVWLEVKHWDVAGFFTGSNLPSISNQERLKAVLKYDQPEIKARIVEFNDKEFFVREINDSHLSLTIDDLDEAELRAMFLDEAYALGQFHRTFGAQKSYLDELDQLKNGKIKDIVESLYEKMVSYLK